MEQALAMVEKAFANGTIGLMVTDLAIGEMFHPLRDEPRFIDILRAMNLDPELGRRLRDEALRNGHQLFRPEFEDISAAR